MSAVFFLKFRGQFVRVIESGTRTVCVLCGRGEATPFTSEADAWHSATGCGLTPVEFIEVEATSSL